MDPMHSLYFTEELRKDFDGKSRATNLPVKFPIHPSSNEKSRRQSEAEVPERSRCKDAHNINFTPTHGSPSTPLLASAIRLEHVI
jgi:hypothetical protein